MGHRPSVTTADSSTVLGMTNSAPKKKFRPESGIDSGLNPARIAARNVYKLPAWGTATSGKFAVLV